MKQQLINHKINLKVLINYNNFNNNNSCSSSSYNRKLQLIKLSSYNNKFYYRNLMKKS